jgi:hypothetical protein
MLLSSLFVHRVAHQAAQGFFLLSALACLLLAGCGGGSKHPRVYPVKGQLFVQGKPAAGARLTLSPENPDPALWKMGFPQAMVQSDGSFAFTSYAEGDGAPPGKYKLIATWIEGDTGIPNEDPNVQPKQLLEPKYAQPDSTPWEVDVEPKTNQLARFEVP